MAQINLSGADSRIIATGNPLPECAFAEGTIIYTLEGALPVEYLTPGDRIIARSGAITLCEVEACAAGFTLHFEKPEVIYADGALTRTA